MTSPCQSVAGYTVRCTLPPAAFVFVLLASAACAVPGAGKTFSAASPVEFEGLRFNLKSVRVDGRPDMQVLSCDLAFESLHDKPLEPLFFPRFTVIDGRGREFEPTSPLVGLDGALNPGMVRDAAVEFHLPVDAVGPERQGVRLRVMCPMVARAGFMMQQARLQGYIFYFDLASAGVEGAGLGSAPSTDGGVAAAPRTTGAEPVAASDGVRNGMSRQQVYDLWGKPLNQTDSGSLSIWGYKRGDAIVTLQFNNDRLTDFVAPFVPPAGVASGTNVAAVLENGLGWKDVYGLWGKPVNMIYTGEISVWGYRRDGGIVTLQFRSGRLVDYSPPFVPKGK